MLFSVFILCHLPSYPIPPIVSGIRNKVLFLWVFLFICLLFTLSPSPSPTFPRWGCRGKNKPDYFSGLLAFSCFIKPFGSKRKLYQGEFTQQWMGFYHPLVVPRTRVGRQCRRAPQRPDGRHSCRAAVLAGLCAPGVGHTRLLSVSSVSSNFFV